MCVGATVVSQNEHKLLFLINVIFIAKNHLAME